jgi:hypothetical protein
MTFDDIMTLNFLKRGPIVPISENTEAINDVALETTTPLTGTIHYAGDPNWRYDEGKILDELRAYLGGTYSAHYVGEEDSIQAIDLIAAGGMVMHFAAASIIKYAFRFGKKDGQNRKDLLKVIHYAMFMLWRLNKGK